MVAGSHRVARPQHVGCAVLHLAQHLEVVHQTAVEVEQLNLAALVGSEQAEGLCNLARRHAGFSIDVVVVHDATCGGCLRSSRLVIVDSGLVGTAVVANGQDERLGLRCLLHGPLDEVGHILGVVHLEVFIAILVWTEVEEGLLPTEDEEVKILVY